MNTWVRDELCRADELCTIHSCNLILFDKQAVMLNRPELVRSLPRTIRIFRMVAHAMAPKIHLVHLGNRLEEFAIFRITTTRIPEVKLRSCDVVEAQEVNALGSVIAIICRAFESQVFVFHMLVKLVPAREAVPVAVTIGIGAAMWASVQVQLLEMKIEIFWAVEELVVCAAVHIAATSSHIIFGMRM